MPEKISFLPDGIDPHSAPEINQASIESSSVKIIEVLKNTREIEENSGSYILFTRRLSKTALVGRQPGEAKLETRRSFGLTTFSVRFESAAILEGQGKVVTYEWDMSDDPLIIRKTQPFHKPANGQKSYGRVEATQVPLTDRVTNRIASIVGAFETSADVGDDDAEA